MKNSKAFTLVELLIVVLIIGILTAVALPKYQLAVSKSRYAALMPATRAIKNAEEEILMATGNYTDQFNDLSVQMPGTIAQAGNQVNNEDGTEMQLTSTDTHNYVKATKEGLNNNYVMYFAQSTNFPGEIHCEALKNDDIAKQLCLSYGSAQGPIAATVSEYDAYVIDGTGQGTGMSALSSDNDPEENDSDPEPEPVVTGSCASGNCFNGSEMDQDRYDILILFAEYKKKWDHETAVGTLTNVKTANKLCNTAGGNCVEHIGDNIYTDGFDYYSYNPNSTKKWQYEIF